MLATSRFTASATAWLLCTAYLLAPLAYAQGSVAEQLTAVRADKSRLEREVAQYRASMDLLRANGAGGVDSPALQALAEELGRTRARLRTLNERERELTAELGSSAGTAAPASAELREVSRLTSLLQGYYSEAESSSTADGADHIATEQLLAQTDLDSDKVLLSGTEGIAAINLISERLSTVSASTASRQRNIVFNVEIRRAGELVSKTNHSLRPVGQSQYVARVSLGGGDARISVRSDQWRVQLEDAGDYLLTLYTPAPGEAQLYVIPVDALRATRWNDTPNWLPPLGNAASRS